MRTSTITTVSDREEDFGFFPSEYKKIKRVIDCSISRRVDITIYSREWNHNKNSTTFFNESTSWFTYEELIEDWLDLTVFEETKREPALMSRLVGDAEMYKRAT